MQTSTRDTGMVAARAPTATRRDSRLTRRARRRRALGLATLVVLVVAVVTYAVIGSGSTPGTPCGPSRYPARRPRSRRRRSAPPAPAALRRGQRVEHGAARRRRPRGELPTARGLLQPAVEVELRNGQPEHRRLQHPHLPRAEGPGDGGGLDPFGVQCRRRADRAVPQRADTGGCRTGERDGPLL